jgi:short-subunit dehydrogenase
MEPTTTRPLAVVTGASSGIGFQLARRCAASGFDLIVAADRPLDDVANDFRMEGARVTIVHADLATQQGVDDLYQAIGGRPVDALLANAGHGLGKGFLEQDFREVEHVIDTNITGTIYLLHKVVRDMRNLGQGKILITGSIAGFVPGSFQAVYNGTKAFIDSFAAALRSELKDTGVTVTCLMPGPTDTEFFARAEMLDTQVATEKKADPAAVAKIGFDAMMDGEADVITGLKNKLQAFMAKITPSQMLAEQHRKLAEPGSAQQSK